MLGRMKVHQWAKRFHAHGMDLVHCLHVNVYVRYNALWHDRELLSSFLAIFFNSVLFNKSIDIV